MRYQNSLGNEEIMEISFELDIPIEEVRRQAKNFLRKRKNARELIKMENQNIYRKTELFDDAIRRVLKSTPYACINDLRT